MKLTEDNFLLFAMRSYDKASVVSITEFEEDLLRFKYLKKLLTRYYQNGDLKERLILNHLIILYNVFGKNATNMLFFKIPKVYWPGLITFLVYLNRMPNDVPEHNLKSSDLDLDENIIQSLRSI